MSDWTLSNAFDRNSSHGFMGSIRITCQCGASLSEPLPSHCPECQRKIAKVQRGAGSGLIQVIVFVVFFAILLGTLYYLVNDVGRP